MARKTFTFRLQKLLDIRVTREKLAQQELIVRQMKLRQELDKLEQLHQRERELIARMTPQPGEMINVDERWMCERYIKVVRKDQEMQQLNVDAAEKRVVEQEAVVTQARIDVKVLEKLKEKQREEFHAEMLREEAYFLDDISSQQFIRQVTLAEADDAAMADAAAGEWKIGGEQR